MNEYSIGVDLGGTDFKRDRDAEFNLKNVPRVELIAMVKATMGMIETVLNGLDSLKLEQAFPKETLGYPMTTRYFLLHFLHVKTPVLMMTLNGLIQTLNLQHRLKSLSIMIQP